MSQLKTLRDRFTSGGYRTASTGDLVLLIDAIMLDANNSDPVAPTQTAGDAETKASGEVPPSSSEAAPAPETPAPAGEDPWTSKA